MSKLFNYRSRENIEETRQEFKTVPYRYKSTAYHHHLLYRGVGGSRFRCSVIKSHTRTSCDHHTKNYTRRKTATLISVGLIIRFLLLALIEGNPILFVNSVVIFILHQFAPRIQKCREIDSNVI